MKRLISATLAFALILILCANPAVAHTEDGDWTPIVSLLDIADSGAYYLTQNITLEDYWSVPAGKNISLCLNGYLIRQTNPSKQVIRVVGAGTELHIYDCGDNYYYFNKASDTDPWTLSEDGVQTEYSIKGGAIMGGNSDNGGGVYVYNDATLGLHGGNIVANRASYRGGGVYVGLRGKFSLTGGKVIGNYVQGPNIYEKGGGGVYLSGSSLSMSGGEISDNTIDYDGGGVCTAGNSEITISGGCIKNNYAADGSGGGVFLYDGGNLTMTGGDITGNRAAYAAGGVKLNEDCVFILSDGNIIYNWCGIIGDGEGGGLYLPRGGEFIMNGGVIANNFGGWYGGGIFTYGTKCEMNAGTIANNEALYYGGGVYIDDDHDIPRAFDMNGGDITNNEASYYGGGVYVSDGTVFNLNKGNVSHNTAGYYGGGVWVNGGTVNIGNGDVSHNTAGYYGGGVCLWSGTVEIDNGNIQNNVANWHGGGVYIESGSYIMRGGNITKNRVNTYYGGGVFTKGTNAISGTVVIKDNKKGTDKSDFYLCEDNVITIDAEGLSPGSSIGVITHVPPTDGSDVIVSPDTSEDYLEYFFADKPDEEVKYTDGDIVLSVNEFEPSYIIIIPSDMTFTDSELTLEKTVNVTELNIGAGKQLNISVRSHNGFKMVQNDETTSFIRYTMNINDDAPLFGTGFHVIAKVASDAPLIDNSYSLSFLHYEVKKEDIDAARFAGLHKDTLTFKSEIE